MSLLPKSNKNNNSLMIFSKMKVQVKIFPIVWNQSLNKKVLIVHNYSNSKNKKEINKFIMLEKYKITSKIRIKIEIT